MKKNDKGQLKENFYNLLNRIGKLTETLDVDDNTIIKQVEEYSKTNKTNITDIDFNSKYIRCGYWEVADKQTHKFLLGLGFKLEFTEDEDRGDLYYYSLTDK